MKLIKLFEEYNTDYLAFNDEYLSIHKILNGANKGKIRFILHDPLTGGGDYKYSMMGGCGYILGTKYDKMPEVRNITVGGFRKVPTNTMEHIFNDFIEDMGYEDLVYAHERKIKEDLLKNFGDEIKKVAEESYNLGDILDGLKNIQNKVFSHLKNDYEEWRLKKDTDKYNL